MAEGFDARVEEASFRLELVVEEDGNDYILWHGYENGEKVTYDVDPYTSIWRRMGIGIMSLMPIDSQL